MIPQIQYIKLDECAKFSQGKQVPVEEQYAEPFEDSVRFVRIVDFTNENEPPRYIKNYGDSYKVNSNDLIMIRYGSQTAGKVVRGFSGIIANNMFKVDIDRTLFDINFAYYYLSSPKIYKMLMNAQSSSTMPAITFGMLGQIEVPLFNLEIQQKIARVLGAIDDKIELNNSINKNLEQQAQAIFKSWFIDFEPFGGIKPDDWEIGVFADLIESTISGDWGKDTLTGNNTENVYCVRGADIPEVRMGNKGKMPHRYILPKNYLTKKLTDGDLVVEISGGSPTQSTGRVAIITEYLLNRYDNDMICTNFCKAIKPKKNYSMFIYYYWLYLYQKNVFFSYENGTTGIKNLDINGFIETEPINIPNEELIIRFTNVCKKFEKQIFLNGYENERLNKLRDTLLPKLMNGEIDVDKVEV